MSGVLAIIPARVGSKGIPNKNWTPLTGYTPVERAVSACHDAHIANIVVTTDKTFSVFSPVYVQKGPVWYRYHWVGAPLHTDTCSMVDVVLDVLRAYPGPPDQKVLLVQPTQPLREPKHLEQAIAMLDHTPSMASVVEVEPARKLYYGGFWPVVMGPDDAARERRQDGQRTFACDGTVYGFTREWFYSNKIFRCLVTGMLVMDPSETARLDTPFDWEMAELRLRSRESKTSCPSCAEYECARSEYRALQEMNKNYWDRASAEYLRERTASEAPSTRASEHQMPLPYDEGR